MKWASTVLDPLVRRAFPWLYQMSPGILSWSLMALAAAIMAWAGRHFYTRAWLAFRHHSADMNTLIVTQQFEDPGSFEGTAARIMSFRRGDDHVYPYDCDPTYGLAIDSRQGPDQE